MSTQGYWVDDRRDGQGKLTMGKKHDVYEGAWVRDKREGYGKKSNHDGSSYEGEWCNNKREGAGKEVTASGDVYVGSFKDNLRHGHGKITFHRGDVYDVSSLFHIRLYASPPSALVSVDTFARINQEVLTPSTHHVACRESSWQGNVMAKAPWCTRTKIHTLVVGWMINAMGTVRTHGGLGRVKNMRETGSAGRSAEREFACTPSAKCKFTFFLLKSLF